MDKKIVFVDKCCPHGGIGAVNKRPHWFILYTELLARVHDAETMKEDHLHRIEQKLDAILFMLAKKPDRQKYLSAKEVEELTGLNHRTILNRSNLLTGAMSITRSS